MSDKSDPLPEGKCGKCIHEQAKNCQSIAVNATGRQECPPHPSCSATEWEGEIGEYLSTHNVIEENAENALHGISQCDICNGCNASISGYEGDKIADEDSIADFSLGPIPGEPSCREDLYPLARFMDLSAGDLLKYRPLGCPIAHFARVIRYDKGIATVHLAGPQHLLGKESVQYKDAHICMVTAFEGSVVQGRIPDIGETIKFVPSHCRMRQVHSGIVVHSEGRRLRIEGIDLKVWR